MSMELLIKKPSDGYARRVEWNFQDLKKDLADSVFKYEGLTYTKEQISDAKKDLAGLRKFDKAINDRRIAIKKEFLESYEVFNGEVRELCAISSPIMLTIDKQIKAFEEKRKQNKKKQLQMYYNENVGDLANILSFNLIFQTSWLNSSFTLGNAQGMIFEIIARTKADLKVINELETKFTNQLLDFYSGSIGKLNLTKTLQENKRLKEKQEKLDEYNAKKVAEAEDAKEQKRLHDTKIKDLTKADIAAIKPREQLVIEVPTQHVDIPGHITPKTFNLQFEATGTVEQFKELKLASLSIGMTIQPLKG